MKLPSLRTAGLLLALLIAATPAGTAEKPDFLDAHLDATVHPGDDFYQHASGGWLKQHPIPADESSWGLFNLVHEELYETLRSIHEKAAQTPSPAGSDEQKIGDFWRAAMDVENIARQGIAPLRRPLARVDAVRSRAQAIEVAFELQTIGVSPFVSFFVDGDRLDSRVASLYAWQGGLGLPDRDFYVNDSPDIAAIRTAYVDYLARVLRLLGRDDAGARTAAADVMRLETALAAASRKLEDTRDPLKNYQRFTPAQLSRTLTPSIRWRERLAAWKVQPAFIAVGQPEYLSALDATLRKTALPVLKDYLRLQLVGTYAESLSPAFDDAHFDFYKRTLSGQQQPRPRWKRIVDRESGSGAVPDSLGMIVARRFVTERFPERAKRRYADMTRAFLDAYADRIRALPWMSAPTKTKALEKLAAMTVKVGYPDRWNDHSALAIGASSHGENIVAIERWAFERSMRRVGRPVDRGEWYLSPQTYNAYYNASNNEIVLAAAVFAIPGVADEDIDDAVAYAYAGASTIGHEITHGFDDEGRKFDARGNLADWWTAQDAAAYEQRAEALVQQFSAYEPLPGFCVNGKASLGENIADLGGLAIALDAFRKTEQYRRQTIVGGKTPMQRFFLGYSMAWVHQMRDENLRRHLLSDVHAPAKYRVIGPVSNVPEFYETFGVTPQHRLWRDPAQRVSIW